METVQADAEGWFTIGSIDTLPLGRGRRFDLDDREVAVFRLEDKVFAIDAHCYHTGGPLEAGDIEDLDGRTCVRCPWHGYEMELETGECLFYLQTTRGGPRTLESKGKNQRVHQALIQDGLVKVKLNLVGKCDSDYYSSDLYRSLMGKAKRN